MQSKSGEGSKVRMTTVFSHGISSSARLVGAFVSRIFEPALVGVLGVLSAKSARGELSYERIGRQPRDSNSGTNSAPTNSRSSGRSMRG